MASNKPSQQERKREFLFKIAHRAEQLLKESPNPQQEMSWAENRLLQEMSIGAETDPRIGVQEGPLGL
jgi:hypothetical protein